MKAWGWMVGNKLEAKGQKICLFHTPSAKRESFVEGNPPLLAAQPWFSNITSTDRHGAFNAGGDWRIKIEKEFKLKARSYVHDN